MVLEPVWNCELPITPPGGDPRVELSLIQQTLNLDNARNPGNWLTWPAPAAQPNAPVNLMVTPWLPALNGID
jgi:hypothetical protein